MERLSTGKRINQAGDDAAGVAIASRLTTEILSVNQSIRNAMDGQSLIDTAEGAHSEIETILQRMREVSVQAANDTNSTLDRTYLQDEIDQLSDEINGIAFSTKWAGKKSDVGDKHGVHFSGWGNQWCGRPNNRRHRLDDERHIVYCTRRLCDQRHRWRMTN